MYLNDETVELILCCYDTSKGYVKETDHAAHAEEIIRMLMERGYEFSDIVDEMGDHDTAFSDAVDTLTEELSEDNHDEGW